MQSECPSCHARVEHEDFLFEVKCDKCGCRFNPFMGAADDAAAGSEPSAMERSEPSAGSTGNFSESQALFQEIRGFGSGDEASADPASEPSASEAAPAPPAAKGAPPRAGAPPSASPSRPLNAPLSADEELIMTPADTLSGYTIEAYIGPLSVWADLDPTAESPMKAAFEALWIQAKARGANGILSLRWELPAGTAKALVIGTAVRCAKAA